MKCYTGKITWSEQCIEAEFPNFPECVIKANTLDWLKKVAKNTLIRHTETMLTLPEPVYFPENCNISVINIWLQDGPLKLFYWPDSYGYVSCWDCTNEKSNTAFWCWEPPDLECECCGSAFSARILRNPELQPPLAPEEASTDDLRKIGWGCDGDDTCASCGLAEFDGLYPCCPVCENCTKCGHADDCKENDDETR